MLNKQELISGNNAVRIGNEDRQTSVTSNNKPTYSCTRLIIEVGFILAENKGIFYVKCTVGNVVGHNPNLFEVLKNQNKSRIKCALG